VTRALQALGQAIAYAAFMALLGYFAANPSYRYADPGKAEIKLSLSHATERIEPCVPLTQEQIAELAANMRRTETCERARQPLVLELDFDGRTVRRVTANPSGLWGDGPASVYERIPVPAGEHAIAVRLRDSGRGDGWDNAAEATVNLAPGRYLTITFRSETGEFAFR
jgi:hypothetical protein